MKFGDPEQRVEIAQAALAVLDVGLDEIAAFARLEMALVALGELAGDEGLGPACGDLLAKALVSSRTSRSSPQMKRASRMAVRMVMSDCASLMQSSTLRVAWPTLRRVSHSA